MHFIWGFIASSAFLLLPPIWSSIASFLYPSPAFSGGGGVFRVFLFSASSVCFNVPFVVVLLHPLWYYWFHCFSFNCAFCPLSSIFFQCIHCLSFYCELCFWDFLFCFLNFIKTVISFTTSAFAFKSTVKNVNTFTMFISNPLLMSLIAHAENSPW